MNVGLIWSELDGQRGRALHTFQRRDVTDDDNRGHMQELPTYRAAKLYLATECFSVGEGRGKERDRGADINRPKVSSFLVGECIAMKLILSSCPDQIDSGMRRRETIYHMC